MQVRNLEWTRLGMDGDMEQAMEILIHLGEWSEVITLWSAASYSARRLGVVSKQFTNRGKHC